MEKKSQKYTIADTRNELLRNTIVRLRTAGIPDPTESTEWFAMEAFGCNRAELWSDPDARIDADELKKFESMVTRRLAREPVQYIVGYTEFFGIRIAVDPRVLIPRPETELVVETSLALAREHGLVTILDIGTGSGCIAVALATRLEKSRVTACDSSLRALDVARTNADLNDAPIRLATADVLDPGFAEHFSGRFDLVVSNPPYIPFDERASTMPEVRDFEPEEALFVDDDPVLFYRAIARHAPDLLNPSGRIVLEIHAEQSDSVVMVLEQADLRDVEVHRDLAGKPRIVTAGLR